MRKCEISEFSNLPLDTSDKPIKGIISMYLKQYAFDIFLYYFDLKWTAKSIYLALIKEDSFLKNHLTLPYLKKWLFLNKNKREEIEDSLTKFCNEYYKGDITLTRKLSEPSKDLGAFENGKVALPNQVAKQEVSNNKVNIANHNELNQPLISSQVSANNVASTKSVNQGQTTAVASTPTFALKKVVKKEEVDPEVEKQKQRDLIGPRPVLPITPIHQNDPRYPFSRDIKNDVIGYDQNGVLFDLLSSENQNDVLPIPTFLDIQCQASDKLISYIVKKNDNEDLPYAFKENSYPFTWDLFQLLLRSEGSIKNGSLQFYVIDVN
ncbi:MAG: hypothetical protein PUG27_09215 [Succinatimonas sp.]|nr:hypothetical protein [Succinatimonas sp.]